MKKCKKQKAMVCVLLMLITFGSFSMTAFATTKNVGGGRWHYGTRVYAKDLVTIVKRVFSNYNHPTRCHSASVSIGSHFEKVCASPGKTASADLEAGFLEGRAQAFWDNESVCNCYERHD